jgi:hypothetical protein
MHERCKRCTGGGTREVDALCEALNPKPPTPKPPNPQMATLNRKPSTLNGKRRWCSVKTTHRCLSLHP